MSSNIRIEKICEWCGKQFTAQTTVTRFCSKRCSEHAYKERLRQQKIQLAKAVSSPKNSELKEKDYLTVAEAGLIFYAWKHSDVVGYTGVETEVRIREVHNLLIYAAKLWTL